MSESNGENLFNRERVFQLVIPLMLEQVLTSLMGMADTLMVSNVGTAAISGVSLVDSINVLIILVFSAMATGGSIVCAQQIGRRDLDEANETARQLMLSTFWISAVAAAVLCAARRPVLSLIFGKVEQSVMDNALIYMIYSAVSYPAIALYSAGAALFRSDGDSRTPLKIALFSNTLNVAGNALLIFVLHLGVRGAAIATLLSRGFSAAAVMILLRRYGQTFVLRDYLKIRPDLRRIGVIMSYGIPSGIENGIFQFGKLVIQSQISAMGTVALAANTLAATLDMFESNPPVGVGLAMMTVVGQCVGAGRYQEAKHHMRVMTGYGEIAITFMSVLVAVLIRPITVLAGLDTQTADLTVRLVMILCIAKPFLWTMSFIPSYGLKGAGDVRFPMVVSVCSMWLCRVVSTVCLIHFFHMGPEAMWYGMTLDWLVRGIFFTVHIRRGKWIKRPVEQ